MTDITSMLKRLDELFALREALQIEYMQNEDDIALIEELILHQTKKSERAEKWDILHEGSSESRWMG